MGAKFEALPALQKRHDVVSEKLMGAGRKVDLLAAAVFGSRGGGAAAECCSATSVAASTAFRVVDLGPDCMGS